MSEDGSITDHIIIVANALLSSPAFQCKWTALNGAQVAVPSKRLMLKNWPPPMLFKFREDKFKERVIERHKLAEDCLPNICTKCGRRCKSVGGLAAHSRSKVCLDMVITKSNKLSRRLYTPAGGIRSKQASGQRSSSGRRTRGGRRGNKLVDTRTTLFSSNSRKA